MTGLDLLILTYVLICIFIGTIGNSRHVGGLLSFFLSLITTPIIGLIIVALSPKKNEKEVKESSSLNDDLLKLNDLKLNGILSDEEFKAAKSKLLS